MAGSKLQHRIRFSLREVEDFYRFLRSAMPRIAPVEMTVVGTQGDVEKRWRARPVLRVLVPPREQKE